MGCVLSSWLIRCDLYNKIKGALHLLQLLRWLWNCLGSGLFKRVMKSSLYGQFLAGEDNEDVIRTAEKNSRAGLYPMFAYTAEEVHGLDRYIHVCIVVPAI